MADTSKVSKTSLLFGNNFPVLFGNNGLSNLYIGKGYFSNLNRSVIVSAVAVASPASDPDDDKAKSKANGEQINSNTIEMGSVTASGSFVASNTPKLDQRPSLPRSLSKHPLASFVEPITGFKGAAAVSITSLTGYVGVTSFIPLELAVTMWAVVLFTISILANFGENNMDNVEQTLPTKTFQHKFDPNFKELGPQAAFLQFCSKTTLAGCVTSLSHPIGVILGILSYLHVSGNSVRIFGDILRARTRDPAFKNKEIKVAEKNQLIFAVAATSYLKYLEAKRKNSNKTDRNKTEVTWVFLGILEPLQALVEQYLPTNYELRGDILIDLVSFSEQIRGKMHATVYASINKMWGTMGVPTSYKQVNYVIAALLGIDVTKVEAINWVKNIANLLKNRKFRNVSAEFGDVIIRENCTYLYPNALLWLSSEFKVTIINSHENEEPKEVLELLFDLTQPGAIDAGRITVAELRSAGFKVTTNLPEELPVKKNIFGDRS